VLHDVLLLLDGRFWAFETVLSLGVTSWMIGSDSSFDGVEFSSEWSGGYSRGGYNSGSEFID